MALIESQDLDAFVRYLDETDNTICGRYPIMVRNNLGCMSKWLVAGNVLIAGAGFASCDAGRAHHVPDVVCAIREIERRKKQTRLVRQLRFGDY